VLKQLYRFVAGVGCNVRVDNNGKRRVACGTGLELNAPDGSFGLFASRPSNPDAAGDDWDVGVDFVGQLGDCEKNLLFTWQGTKCMVQKGLKCSSSVSGNWTYNGVSTNGARLVANWTLFDNAAPYAAYSYLSNFDDSSILYGLASTFHTGGGSYISQEYQFVDTPSVAMPPGNLLIPPLWCVNATSSMVPAGEWLKYHHRSALHLAPRHSLPQ
jgi:hypothetical protein